MSLVVWSPATFALREPSIERGSEGGRVRVGSEERREAELNVERGSEDVNLLGAEEISHVLLAGDYANKHLPFKEGLCSDVDDNTPITP